MYELKISLPYLEGLTTGELNTLADSFALDIPPGLDRNFIIEELLEFAPCLSLYQQNIINGIPADPPPPPLVKTTLELPDPVMLPKQYNTTYIDVLVRDPYWIFVIWEVSGQDRKKHEKTTGFEGYILRVHINDCPQNKDQAHLHIAKIGERDSERYLNFPMEIACDKLCKEKNCSFIIELCAVHHGKTEKLVSSSPFMIPHGGVDDAITEEKNSTQQMLRLSGLEKIKIVRGAL